MQTTEHTDRGRTSKRFSETMRRHRSRNCRPAQSIQLEHVVKPQKCLRSVCPPTFGSRAESQQPRLPYSSTDGIRQRRRDAKHGDNRAGGEFLTGGNRPLVKKKKTDRDGGSTKARIARNGDFGKITEEGTRRSVLRFSREREGEEPSRCLARVGKLTTARECRIPPRNQNPGSEEHGSLGSRHSARGQEGKRKGTNTRMGKGRGQRSG